MALAQDKSGDPFRLINSDEKILGVLQESNQYLDTRADLTERINERIWIWRSLCSLLPQTVEKLWSGHVFPVVDPRAAVLFLQRKARDGVGVPRPLVSVQLALTMALCAVSSRSSMRRLPEKIIVNGPSLTVMRPLY